MSAKIIFFFFISAIFLTGCAPTPNHHGVSDTSWQQLTTEQKQMIVDDDFNKMMKSEVIPDNTNR